MARTITSELTRAEQLRVNQKNCHDNKKASGNVRLEIWLPKSLRDKFSKEAKEKGVSRSEYVLSLIEQMQDKAI